MSNMSAMIDWRSIARNKKKKEKHNEAGVR